jgi:hypothetical protein
LAEASARRPYLRWGRLADPTNLPFDDAHLEDDAMKAALDDLLT